MKRESISWLLVFAAAALSSCKHEGKDQKSKDKDKTVVVSVAIAEKVDFPSNIEVNGSVLPEEMVELHPEVSGRLTLLDFPDGARVSRGTILARINDAELQAQLRQQLAQLELAKKTEQRLSKLLEVKGVNQSDYDAAQSQVNALQANVDVLRAQIDKTVLKAPFDGVLGLRQVSPGAYVSPATLIGTIQQTDRIKIDFTVPDEYASLVKVGNKVTVYTRDSSESREAMISAVEPQINSSTRNIKARARLKSAELMPGTFVKVLLHKNTRGILVPTNAIIPDAMSNQVVVVKGGLAQFNNVEMGQRTANVVEITKGLDIGDSIVVSGVLFVRQKSKLTIKKVVKITDGHAQK